MNEAQVKAYMGWTKESEMLSFYSFVNTEDSNNAMKEHYGIIEDKDKKKPKAPRECPRCKEVNKYNALRCKSCGMVIDLIEAAKISEDYTQLEQKQESSNKLLYMLAKKEMEKLKGKDRESFEEILQNIENKKD